MAVIIKYFSSLADLRYMNYKIGDVIPYGLVNVFQTTWSHIPEERNFNSVLNGPNAGSTLRITWLLDFSIDQYYERNAVFQKQIQFPKYYILSRILDSWQSPEIR